MTRWHFNESAERFIFTPTPLLMIWYEKVGGGGYKKVLIYERQNVHNFR